MQLPWGESNDTASLGKRCAKTDGQSVGKPYFSAHKQEETHNKLKSIINEIRTDITHQQVKSFKVKVVAQINKIKHHKKQHPPHK
jgi:hypothetical protein